MIESSWEPSKEAEGSNPIDEHHDIVHFVNNKMSEWKHEEQATNNLRLKISNLMQHYFGLLSDTTVKMSQLDYPKDSKSVALVNEQGNQTSKKIQEVFNDQFNHQKYQTVFETSSLLVYLQVFSRSLLNELVNIYANPWNTETTEKDYKSRNCINLRRKPFSNKSRRANKRKQSIVLKSYTEIIGYGRSAFRVPLHVLNVVVLMIQALFIHCWKSTNTRKPKCYQNDVLDCNNPTESFTPVTTTEKEFSCATKSPENVESSDIITTCSKNIQVNKASCLNGNTTTASTGDNMSSSNMNEINEIIRQELSALAGGFGDNGNGNNGSNDNNMLNEDSMPLEDLGDLYDSDFEMTDEYEEEFYESDDPISNGPWSIPQPSLSPLDAHLRLQEAEYARYIRDADDEVWLTQGHFQDESSQSGEESSINPSSPKPPYTDDDDESDAKVPELHM